MPDRLEDYALIGDCETAALVSRCGSIDWLCWPRFDSPACFAALLGTADHGCWTLRPCDRTITTKRRYRAQTLILETLHETPQGRVMVVDFMPPRGRSPHVVRLVAGQAGCVKMRTDLTVRFDYGSARPWSYREEDGSLSLVAGPDRVSIATPAVLNTMDFHTTSEFEVRPGEVVPFVLTYSTAHAPLPLATDAFEALQQTEAFWSEWASVCEYRGRWRDEVLHSHLILKALTYQPTGGILAAPTTSLPEQLGGERNWDYRYCWLRDAALTLLSLVAAGYLAEARAWRTWLIRAVAGCPDQVQVMYGLAGERRLMEWELPWLPGYEHSRPVRVGNAAYSQLQIDIFGEVLDALYQARAAGLEEGSSWALEQALAEHVERTWMQPDQGIWEMRGPPQHFTHSKVMAWVALDRTIRSAEEFDLLAPLEHWRSVRQQIHDDVCRRGFDGELGSFVQAYGRRQLDASLLLLPLVGFLPAEDPRVRGTVAAIERHLFRDGFVLRYDTAETRDGLPAGEGAFLACSFWLVDNWVLQGRQQEAEALFSRLLSLRNDVGLLSEQYDPRRRRLTGNFPQAFSHLALAASARNLAGAADAILPAVNLAPRSGARQAKHQRPPILTSSRGPAL